MLIVTLVRLHWNIVHHVLWEWFGSDVSVSSMRRPIGSKGRKNKKKKSPAWRPSDHPASVKWTWPFCWIGRSFGFIYIWMIFHVGKQVFNIKFISIVSKSKMKPSFYILFFCSFFKVFFFAWFKFGLDYLYF